jgi:anti-sigma regulatory factor (Ser/Thr protein kinase)
MELPCDDEAPGMVRDALESSSETRWALGDAMLVASELVTNAVLHSGCSGDHPIKVEVRLQADRLLIMVRDPGLSGADALARQNETGGGWGLTVVDELAQRWGTERGEDYCVWAEVALPA